MFSKATAPVTEPAPDVIEQGSSGRTSLIPLSHLELDLPAPGSGWDAYLTGRGIQIVLDHIGRSAISSADARQLFDEQREVEARRRDVAARQEQQAIEADRRFRAALPKGLHWSEIPVGVSAAEMWAAAEKDAKPKRRTPLEDAFAGEGMVFHSIQGEEAS
jgi:hypothetical protein